MIVLKHVTKIYRGVTVFSDISLRINPGEFVCVTGGSGAGKSTLLGLLVGAEHPTMGTVEVDGVDLRAIPPLAMQIFRHKVGMVFQDRKLLPHRTVWENVAFPLEVNGASPDLIRKRVPAVLSYLGLDLRNSAFPEELSSGEKTCVALARAIVHKPAILLADEPLADLDATQKRQVLRVLRDFHALGSTVILATHDTELVEALQARTITLHSGHAMDGARKEEASAAVSSPSPQEAQRKVKITSLTSPTTPLPSHP